MEKYYLVDGDVFARLELIIEYGHCLNVGDVVSIEEMTVGQTFSIFDPTGKGEKIIIERIKQEIVA